MGEKKRKGVSAVAEPPQKKSKKSAPSTEIQQEKPKAKEVTKPEPVPVESGKNNSAALGSKKSRKRAADFLSDNEDVEDQVVNEPKKTSKKGKKTSTSTDAIEAAPTKKKSKKDKAETLTADGVNGVIETATEATVKPSTAQKVTEKSLQAEAQRTVDKEIEDEFGFGENEEEGDDEIDQAAALLTGFDSDNEDPAEDKDLDLSRTAPVPQYKKTQKKLQKAKAEGNKEGPGTVYVGRIPHGFYEQQMREYFSQFGDISKLRLSRNRQTGASKHFAFIEFTSTEVAKIVAETMDNYLMFGHILKCKYAPQENLHPDLWKGANQKFRKLPRAKLQRDKLAAPKSKEFWQNKVSKEQGKRAKLAEKLKALDYELPKSTLTNPEDVVAKRKLEAPAEEAPAQIEENPAPRAIEAADTTTKDVEAGEKGKKSKKDKKTRLEKLPEEPATESIPEVTEKKAGKKSKKEKDVAQVTIDPVKESTVSKVQAEPKSKTTKRRKSKE